MRFVLSYFFIILSVFVSKIFLMPVMAQTSGTKAWSFPVGGDVHSSPAIDDSGIIYFGSQDDKVYAVNPDGTKRWEFTTGYDVYSSPALAEDGTIYIGSNDNNLYAINPDGTEKWKYLTDADVYSSPAIARDGTIYVGSDDNNLYAINPDGSLKWKYLTDGDIESSPVIGGGGVIYVGSNDNKLYAINPDGTLLWEYTTGGAVRSSPAISGKGVIFVGSEDNFLHAVSMEGDPVWTYKTTGDIWSSPAIGSDGVIYFGSHDNNFYAVKEDGSLFWKYTTSGDIESSPVVAADGTIYFGSDDNRLYALNPDGTNKWDYSTSYDFASSPVIGNNGLIYCGSDQNYLFAIHCDNDQIDDGPWPKFRNDQRNSGYYSGIICETGFLVDMVNPGEKTSLSFGIYNNHKSEITVSEISINQFENYSLSTSLPVSISSGGWQLVEIEPVFDSSAFYQNEIMVHYSLEGDNHDAYVPLEAAVFMNDGSERSYVASQAIAAYIDALFLSDQPISLANNTGVILRLLEEYELAESQFQKAVNQSLANKFGFAGIKMNLGVIHSDKAQSVDAFALYGEAFKDISSGESGSALAPQIYYNQAWEAYQSADMITAKNKANSVISHAMTNNYLKAKAKALLGAVEAVDENYTGARALFREAINLDNEGPVGDLAYENLAEISRPRILEDPAGAFKCAGDDAVIKVSLFGEAPFTFQWFMNGSLLSGENSDSIIVQDVLTNLDRQYSCVVENQFGTDTSAMDLRMHLPGKPEIAPEGPVNLCIGDEVTLVAPLAGQYLWSDSSLTQSITVRESGDFYVTITDERGCISPVSDTVSVRLRERPAKPDITIKDGDNHLCTGETLTLVAPPGYEYLWSNNLRTREITVKGGSYSLIVKDEYCESLPSDELGIHVHSTPSKPEVIYFYEEPLCEGDSVMLFSSEGYTYQWSNGETKQDIVVYENGIYSVEYISEHGCVSERSNEIVVSFNTLPPKPAIAVSNSTLISSAGDGNQWFRDGMIIEDADQPEYTAEEDGNYHVMVTNDAGCSITSDGINIIIDDLMYIEANERIKIYPNPNDGEFVLRFGETSNVGEGTLKIYNSDSKLIYNNRFNMSDQPLEFSIGGESIPDGVYYIHFVTDKKIYTGKMIIRK